ncbi:Crp/Fnr family transcriptional regulator [uncultured Algimonas sp.]|uniref:Crp/Fnr family transcriptional regulator n=1 Tax=uncultured Algimonas sp. TaxID=1547920 RepID=UPI0026216D15|nr:Crp/Fnr family transcriptional regulator [uncultured Algimonas sp.]
MDDAKLQLQALLPTNLRHRPWIDSVSLRLHDLGAREPIFRAGEPMQRLYFVAKGWIHESTVLSYGIKPISTLRIRGDALGLTWLERANRMEDVGTITPCELISVSAEAFRDCMRQDPVLQAFVHDELVRDMMNLRMMSAVVGQMKAPDRLAYFLFIMLHRCRRTYPNTLRTLPLPLTQEEIGRTLGLTNVSVNRAFRALESENLIQTGRQSVTFLDEQNFACRFDMDKREDLVEQLTVPLSKRSQAA